MARWGIIGAGMLGMTLAYRLRQHGHEVSLFEAGPTPGGLASAWSVGGVVWDRHYHVMLLSDSYLCALLNELGLTPEARWAETKTGVLAAGQLYSVSNVIEFLKFPPLSLFAKIRLGATIFGASRIRNWRKLESEPVERWLRRWSGDEATNELWLPLLRAKLGDCYRHTSAAFIWATVARMYAARRTGLKKEMFGYIAGGYARILDCYSQRLRDIGVNIRCNTQINQVRSAGKDDIRILDSNNASSSFDRVVLTIPSPAAVRACPALEAREARQHLEIEYVGIVCASVLLKRSLSPYYITNIAESGFPFTAVIEMSALVDKARFNGQALVYLPKYVSPNDPVFELDDATIRQDFLAGLRRIHPLLSDSDVSAFRVSRARHVFALSTLGYSTRLPSTATTIPGVHIINSAHIVNGTLNVNETLALAERVLPTLLADCPGYQTDGHV